MSGAVAKIVYVKCSLNSVAHSLVNMSKVVGCRTWLGHVPIQCNSHIGVSLFSFI
jgi:hypothetical protein